MDVFAHATNLQEYSQSASFPKGTIDWERKQKWWTKSYFSGEKKEFRNFIKLYGLSTRLTEPPASDNAFSQKYAQIYEQDAEVHFPDTMHDIPALVETIRHVAGISGHEWLCGEYISTACHEVSNALAETSDDALDEDAVLRSFLLFLNRRLAETVMPAVILEANIARLTGESQTCSPEERFNLFVRDMGRTESKKKIWHKYPVLLRNVRTISDNCSLACQKVIRHIVTDLVKIRTCFSIPENKPLTNVIWGTGDPHCGGECVAILHFGERKIVYKPKNLGIYGAFNKFLQWYNASTTTDFIQPYKVFCCGSHGYTEYIAAYPCSSENQLKEFYRKMGALLGLFWFLGGTDLHFENLIASGPDPYAIDLETLFDKQPSMPKRLNYQNCYLRSSRELLYKTYILPRRSSCVQGVYDISAIGAVSVQTAGVQVRKIVNAVRDDVRLVFEPGIIERGNNIPAQSEKTLTPDDYTEQILSGYANAVEVLKKHKSILFSDDGPLELFRGARTRWVPRATQDYSRLLHETDHPSMLKNAIDCDMLMGGALMNSQQSPHLTCLIKSEIADLWEKDIPYFSTTPESCSLFDARGNEIKNFFSEDAFTAARKRLNNIDKYKVLHAAVIRESLASTSSKTKDSPLTYHPRKNLEKVTSPREILSLATNVAKEIQKTAYITQGIPFWSSFNQLDTSNYGTSILPPTLYEGAPGIGLFFACLYRHTKDKKHRDLAIGSHKLIRDLFKDPEQLSSCGAYDGFSGLIYCDLLLSRLLKRPNYTNDSAFRYLKCLVEKDESLDIISGAAGALLVSLRCIGLINNDSVRMTAEAAAEKLRRKAIVTNNMAAWPTIGYKQPTLLGGMAHGVSGIAWALSEWGGYSRDESFLELSRQAAAYETSLLDHDVKAWKDNRSASSYGSAWCHGSAGIGMAITMLNASVQDMNFQKKLLIARDHVWKSGFNSHCLCHGAFGNVELFRKGSRDIANTYVENAIIAYRQTGRWQCGYTKNVPVPGLMCGLAGIGYGLLRHLDAPWTPNVLLFET